MSIPNLPVNFKDDILAASNPKRKYRQTTNDDSTVSFEDVTNYSQEGSRFGAKEVNQTNTAINNIYDERILDLDELELVTEPGFFVDAQAAKEAYDALNSNNAWGERQTIGQTIGLSVFFRRNAYMYQIEVSGSINSTSIPLGGRKLANLPEGIAPPKSSHRYMSTDSRLSIQVNTVGEIWLYSTSNISTTRSGINVAFTEPILS